MIPVVIPPDLWEGDAEGAVSAWLFAEGDAVRAGDLIAEVQIMLLNAQMAAAEKEAAWKAFAESQKAGLGLTANDSPTTG